MRNLNDPEAKRNTSTPVPKPIAKIGPIRAYDPSRKGPVPRDREVAHVKCLQCGAPPKVLTASVDDDYRPSISAKCWARKCWSGSRS